MVTGLENELEGITVISVEQAVAGPYCGMLLADAGARVIKIERPGVILHVSMTAGQKARALFSSG